LHSRRKMFHPVPYAYVGGSGWTPEDDDYLCLGGGLKWTVTALSLGGEICWRGVWNKTYRRDVGYERHRRGRLSLSITFEIGGWWAQRKDENTREDESFRGR
jgi:hypothetical protein